MNQSPKFDIAVIGGGIAGLTAALYAARAGFSVVLFEKGAQSGGRATTHVVDGYHFNQGPHALYRGGEGIEILAELGIDCPRNQASYGGAWFLRNGAKFRWPGDAEGWLATEMLSPEARQETLGLMASLDQLANEESRHLSVREWLDTTIRHPEVRQLFEGIIRLSTYCGDPEKHNAHAALEQTAIGRKGVDYLDGGWQSLVNRLADTAQSAGVRLETRHQVTAIRCEGDEAHVELADGSKTGARNVIATVGPEVIARLVNGGGSAALRQAADGAIPVYAACLDVALRHLPNPAHQFAIGLDQPWYYSVHTRSARLAPEGGAIIQLAKYLPSGTSASIAAVQAELEGIMDWLQPGWREALVEKRFLPRMLVTNTLVTVAHGGADGRPGCVVPKIPNLFLAGDWVGAHGMLVDTSFASAREAASLAIARLRESAECIPVTAA